MSGFTPRFTLTGAPPLVRAYGIVASQEWDVGDILKWSGDRTLQELSAANENILGSALGNVGNSTTGQSDANELRSYLTSTTTGRHEPVAIFCETTVFEADDLNNVGGAAYTDVGELMVLELVSSEWGLNNGAATAGSTPSFRCIDINDARGTYYVIPAPLEATDIWQWFDAAA